MSPYKTKLHIPNYKRVQVKLHAVLFSAILALVLASFSSSPASSHRGNPLIPPAQPTSAHATAIILFLGDGMGDEHRKAGRWASVGQSGQLAMDDLPYQGWLQTASADNPITDSAASATAMATGFKTDNGHISVDPDEAILETLDDRY